MPKIKGMIRATPTIWWEARDNMVKLLGITQTIERIGGENGAEKWSLFRP